WFADWGYWVIFANRFLSGTRSVVSIFAGLFHLNPFYVFGLGLISTMFWNGILISLGLLLGENWNILIDYISRYNFIFIVLTILVFLVIFINKFLKKKKNTEVNSE
ncbi:MAG: DedA family protein, partial [Calditrichia bacterium]|nr:DedA family protein [Calditrichia bacterium]